MTTLTEGHKPKRVGQIKFLIKLFSSLHAPCKLVNLCQKLYSNVIYQSNIYICSNVNYKSSEVLTLVLGAETSQLVVAIGGKVQSKPVLAADDGRGQVGAGEPDRKAEKKSAFG